MSVANERYGYCKQTSQQNIYSIFEGLKQHQLMATALCVCHQLMSLYSLAKIDQENPMGLVIARENLGTEIILFYPVWLHIVANL